MDKGVRYVYDSDLAGHNRKMEVGSELNETAARTDEMQCVHNHTGEGASHLAANAERLFEEVRLAAEHDIKVHILIDQQSRVLEAAVLLPSAGVL
jgi:hypothetical protein